MTHKRKTIRDAVVTILTNASIVATGQVYSNRRFRIDEDSLPALNVYSATETSVPANNTQTTYLRTLTLIIMAVAENKASEAIDDSMDALALAVENAMKADLQLAGTAIDNSLTATDFVEDETGQITAGQIALTYQVKYIA